MDAYFLSQSLFQVTFVAGENPAEQRIENTEALQSTHILTYSRLCTAAIKHRLTFRVQDL